MRETCWKTTLLPLDIEFDTMSPVECLREFVNERLTAAAEEIFRVFKQTVVEYEKEIDRQRGLLDIIWKPHTRSHMTGV